MRTSFSLGCVLYHRWCKLIASARETPWIQVCASLSVRPVQHRPRWGRSPKASWEWIRCTRCGCNGREHRRLGIGRPGCCQWSRTRTQYSAWRKKSTPACLCTSPTWSPRPAPRKSRHPGMSSGMSGWTTGFGSNGRRQPRQAIRPKSGYRGWHRPARSRGHPGSPVCRLAVRPAPARRR